MKHHLSQSQFRWNAVFELGYITTVNKFKRCICIRFAKSQWYIPLWEVKA